RAENDNETSRFDPGGIVIGSDEEKVDFPRREIWKKPMKIRRGSSNFCGNSRPLYLFREKLSTHVDIPDKDLQLKDKSRGTRL
ncbi:227_t:CDS:2, partial [Dentiscutata erythropus]